VEIIGRGVYYWRRKYKKSGRTPLRPSARLKDTEKDQWATLQQAAPAGMVCAAAGEAAFGELPAIILALTAAPIPAISAPAISQR